MDGKRRNRAVLTLVVIAAVTLISVTYRGGAEEIASAIVETKRQTVADAPKPTNPLDAQRAYRYLQELCAIGPRVSGSPGMARQQALLEGFFKKAGAKVTLQQFRA